MGVYMESSWGQFIKGTFFTAFAGFSSIISLVLSVILIVISLKVNNKINNKLKNRDDIEYFNDNRISYAETLEGYQLFIKIDKVLDIQLIANITTAINQFENLNSILTKKDKKNINSIKKELVKDVSNADNKTKQKICNGLSYFISRYSKEEIIL